MHKLSNLSPTLSLTLFISLFLSFLPYASNHLKLSLRVEHLWSTCLPVLEEPAKQEQTNISLRNPKQEKGSSWYGLHDFLDYHLFCFFSLLSLPFPSSVSSFLLCILVLSALLLPLYPKLLFFMSLPLFLFLHLAFFVVHLQLCPVKSKTSSLNFTFWLTVFREVAISTLRISF